jgi:hypothetical protein
VQHGVREHGIEAAVEGQRPRVHHMSIDAARSGGGNHVRRGINADHRCARRHESDGQVAVPAPEIEDALAGPRRQTRQNGGAEGGNEERVLLVVGR